MPASTNSFAEFMIASANARTAAPQAVDADALAKGQAAVDAAGLANASCSNLGAGIPIPFVLSALYVLRTLEISDNAVTMNIDADGFELQREIDLTLAAHPANLTPSLLGHSIGHWEGQTLVIDTAAFSPVSGVSGQSERKHMVERLTLTDDRRQLKYEFTVDDPEYYPQPFSYSMLWNHRPDLAMSGAACDDALASKFRTLE